MKKNKLTIAVLTVMALVSSCSNAQKSIIPVSDSIQFEDTYTIIWNGYSKAYAYEDGQYKRMQTMDYYFDVIQKRYDKKWKSVKSLHRIHPNYSGKAGERDQTMYFEVNYQSILNDIVEAKIKSSLGEGSLKSDNEYRNITMLMEMKDASSFLPYNRIRITQKYDYENGKLTELVELFKLKDGKETPFMKNEEEAYFYIKGKLDKAPQTYK